MKNSFKVGNNIIGEGHSSYIIAEMSANHGGSYQKAIEIIHAAAKAGADCIKLQTYTAETMTLDSNKKYFQLSSGAWKGQYLYNLYQQAHTPWKWQSDLKKEAEKVGIDFFSTPFDISAVDFLESINIEFYKIASFELNDLPLIKYIAEKGKPIIISTGMATLGEIEEALNVIKQQKNDQVCLLKCSSTYPAVSENLNLKTILALKKMFNLPIGFSDHSMGDVAAITAVVLGANVIEKHFCLTREFKTPDSFFSMEPHEFKEMVNNIRLAEKAIGKISFDLSSQEKMNRAKRRSIFISKDIEKGEIITSKNIKIIRPADGLAPKYYNDVLNKKTRYKLTKGLPLSWEMLE
ncbi:pseudaminic acid synthase [Promethearchaeum syntrophicum]|uniref:Pseudaminic acid synthase n=1 Tax=Promethearchaeum syntrophicum TaxID=2594042 RepID=A0A5B9D9T3_9ARCH|nr:pseudaminic acid synthase [Candidatus Prometheoarchaeum syntrophicum]QEE16028.1 3-deoxy-7-phosphoheptulonate synthase [Candidatus Prometheoarchaeum syntrophicum]